MKILRSGHNLWLDYHLADRWLSINKIVQDCYIHLKILCNEIVTTDADKEPTQKLVTILYTFNAYAQDEAYYYFVSCIIYSSSHAFLPLVDKWSHSIQEAQAED